MVVQTQVDSRPLVVEEYFNAIASMNNHDESVSPELVSMSDFSSFLNQMDLREIPTDEGLLLGLGFEVMEGFGVSLIVCCLIQSGFIASSHQIIIQ